MLKLLDFSIPLRVPQANRFYGAGRLLVQIMNTNTRDVWQPTREISLEDFEALPVAAPFYKFYWTYSISDLCWYDRSPGMAHHGPLVEKWFGPHKFVLISCSEQPQPLLAPGVVRIPTQMYANHGFKAGRTLSLLTNETGQHYLEIAHNRQQDTTAIEVPAGMALRHITLRQPQIFVIEPPCEIIYFIHGMHCFIGPVQQRAFFDLGENDDGSDAPSPVLKIVV